MGFLGNSSLDGVRGRHVIRTLFGSTNLTRDNILRWDWHPWFMIFFIILSFIPYSEITLFYIWKRINTRALLLLLPLHYIMFVLLMRLCSSHALKIFSNFVPFQPVIAGWECWPVTWIHRTWVHTFRIHLSVLLCCNSLLGARQKGS